MKHAFVHTNSSLNVRIWKRPASSEVVEPLDYLPSKTDRVRCTWTRKVLLRDGGIRDRGPKFFSVLLSTFHIKSDEVRHDKEKPYFQLCALDWWYGHPSMPPPSDLCTLWPFSFRNEILWGPLFAVPFEKFRSQCARPWSESGKKSRWGPYRDQDLVKPSHFTL